MSEGGTRCEAQLHVHSDADQNGANANGCLDLMRPGHRLLRAASAPGQVGRGSGQPELVGGPIPWQEGGL